MSDSHSTFGSSVKPLGKLYPARGGGNSVNSDSSLYLDEQHSDSFGADLLSIALIGPDEDRRKAVASALAGCQGGEIREFFSYPASLDDVPKLLEQHFDIIVIDLDSQPEYALELVESICASAHGDGDGLFGEDRRGAAGALHAGGRARVSHPALRAKYHGRGSGPGGGPPSGDSPAAAKKAGGRLLVFLGAKGGDGVTTLACNFAVSLAQESEPKHAADRSGSAAGRCRAEPGRGGRILDHQRAAERQPAGFGLSLQAAGQAQLGRFGAGCAGQVSPVSGHQ